MKEKDKQWVRDILQGHEFDHRSHYHWQGTPRVFDCPECKHKTMGEVVTESVTTGRRISSLVYAYSHPSSPPYLVDEVINKSRVICLNCGDKFEKPDKEVWDMVR